MGRLIEFVTVGTEPTMVNRAPSEIRSICSASDESVRRQAWEKFVQEYSRLILHAASAQGGGHDAVMDRYAYILDQLHSDDFKKLRAYSARPTAKFTTWLVVVAQRMCTDFHRSRYGRQSGANNQGNPGDGGGQAQATRRRLADLVADNIEVETLRDYAAADPATAVMQRELAEALEDALKRLSNRDRLLLALRFEDGARAREIADVMGFPSQFHVYRRLNAVLAGLKQELVRHGIEGPGA